MRQLKALQTLQASGKKIFSSADLQKILRTENSAYGHVLAGRLIKTDVLKRVMRGYYVLTGSQPSSFELANMLYRPSYISLESALSYYGILIQSPREITSVTVGAAKRLEADGKTYSYTHLDRKYFSDYQKVKGFLIATPEKALIDSMFLTALGRGSLSLEELNLTEVDKTKVKEIASRINNRAFKNYFATATAGPLAAVKL